MGRKLLIELTPESLLQTIKRASDNILNVSQVGNEKAHHKIWAIVQTALFPDTVKSYSQENVKY